MEFKNRKRNSSLADRQQFISSNQNLDWKYSFLGHKYSCE